MSDEIVDIPGEIAYEESRPGREVDDNGRTLSSPLWLQRQRYKDMRTGALVSSKLHQMVHCPSSISLATLGIHLRVYLLADCHGIVKLKNLAIHKMHMDLPSGTFAAYVPETMATLVAECYNGTASSDSDAMRQLLVSYCAQRNLALWQNEDFRKMAADIPDFSRDFISQLA